MDRDWLVEKFDMMVVMGNEFVKEIIEVIIMRRLSILSNWGLNDFIMRNSLYVRIERNV